eukprot:scaffold22848_cov165-Skeletonema_dohrnii-CCMP3373.AAC.2
MNFESVPLSLPCLDDLVAPTKYSDLYYNTLANSLWLGSIQIDRGGARNDSPEFTSSQRDRLFSTGQISFRLDFDRIEAAFAIIDEDGDDSDVQNISKLLKKLEDEAPTPMMDSDKEAHTTTDNSVEGDIYRADGSSGSLLEEEEKIEEDVSIEDRPAETRPGSSGSGQLKTPEDEHDGINDTSDVYEENNSAHGHDENTNDASDMHVHGQEATLPQKGIVEAATDENTNAAFEDDSVVFDDGDDHRRVAGSNVAETRSIVEPGATFIPGPGYTGTGIQTGYISDPDDDNINEGAVILQGFLPEDDPSRRRNSRAESAEERVQRLIDNAITLEDSA